ncbi:hypothetical protein [Spiroplasma endosymbiont of Asaphidion curtum]|uniref:hypothetical protein n=1 Tax=Spiroplasma endosymbiont of Asaphidion curtum TaxID=3066281 RepID=UPI00313F1518
MKKLLSLLSVLTISGTVMPTVIAASSYQKQETIKNSDNNVNNYQQVNNLKLKRIKRTNYSTEKNLDTELTSDEKIFLSLLLFIKNKLVNVFSDYNINDLNFNNNFANELIRFILKERKENLKTDNFMIDSNIQQDKGFNIIFKNNYEVLMRIRCDFSKKYNLLDKSTDEEKLSDFLRKIMIKLKEYKINDPEYRNLFDFWMIIKSEINNNLILRIYFRKYDDDGFHDNLFYVDFIIDQNFLRLYDNENDPFSINIFRFMTIAAEQPETSGINQSISVDEQAVNSNPICKIVADEKIVVDLIQQIKNDNNNEPDSIKIKESKNNGKIISYKNKKKNKKTVIYKKIHRKKILSYLFGINNNSGFDLGEINDTNSETILKKFIKEVKLKLINEEIPEELLTESNLYVVPRSITENSAIITINYNAWSYGTNLSFRYRGGIFVTFNINQQNYIPQRDLQEAGPSGLSNSIRKDNDEQKKITNLIQQIKNRYFNIGTIEDNSRNSIIEEVKKLILKKFHLSIDKNSIIVETIYIWQDFGFYKLAFN